LVVVAVVEDEEPLAPPPPPPPEKDERPKEAPAVVVVEAGDESEVAPVEAVDLCEPASDWPPPLRAPKTEGEMDDAVVSTEQAERSLTERESGRSSRSASLPLPPLLLLLVLLGAMDDDKVGRGPSATALRLLLTPVVSERPVEPELVETRDVVVESELSFDASTTDERARVTARVSDLGVRDRREGEAGGKERARTEMRRVWPAGGAATTSWH